MVVGYVINIIITRHLLFRCVCALAFSWQLLKSMNISIYDPIDHVLSLVLLFRIKLTQIRWLTQQSQRKGVCLTCQIGVLVSLLLQKSMYVLRMLCLAWNNLCCGSILFVFVANEDHLVFKCLLQFDNLSLDQDMLSLRKECQEKDATIKDLTSFLQLTNKAGSKVRLFQMPLNFGFVFLVPITYTNMFLLPL